MSINVDVDYIKNALKIHEVNNYNAPPFTMSLSVGMVLGKH